MHTVFVELVEEIGSGLVCGRQVELVTKSLETLDVHRLLPARVVVERRYNAQGEITCVVSDASVIRDTWCRVIHVCGTLVLRNTQRYKSKMKSSSSFIKGYKTKDVNL